MKKLIITRSKWFRGKGSERSALLTRNGKMCCLGFLGLACGLQKKDMRNSGAPSEISEELLAKWSKGIIRSNAMDSALGVIMMGINDDPSLKPKYREVRLKGLFERINYRVEFKK